MTPNEKRSSSTGILSVIGGMLYMGLGVIGIQYNQQLASLFLGGQYIWGLPVTEMDRFKALAVTTQSGLTFLVGAAVSVIGVIVGLQALQTVTPQAPPLSQ